MIHDQEPLAATHIAVLHVSPELVEWYEHDGKGNVRYGGVVPAGLGPEALAKAAHEAWRKAKGTSQRCVLMLGSSLVLERSVKLPKMKRKELTRTLGRKAAGLFKGEAIREDQILFHALEGREGEDSEISEWHVVAMDGEVLRPLRAFLRQRRFDVQRVVSGHLSALALGQATGGDPSQPFLSVVVRDDDVTLNLVRGNAILSRGHMEGNPSSSPSVVASLLHEIRSSASFWKRASRGALLSKVVVIGLAHDRGLLLAKVIERALVDTEIYLLPGQPASGTEAVVGRYSLLGAANVEAALAPDLSFRIPPSRTRVAAVLAACVLFAAGLGWGLSGRVQQDLTQLRGGISQLALRSKELHRVEERHSTVSQEARELEKAVGRIAEIGAYGIPLQRVLQGILQGFAGRAELRNAALTALADGDYELRLDGEVRGSTSVALARLRGLRATLRASEIFDEVWLELGSRLPDTPNGSFSFAITARGGRGEIG